MAGRPKRRAMILELEARARTHAAEDGGDGTILDYACDWIASGKTIASLAADLTRQLKLPYSREGVSKYLNGLAPDARQRLVDARGDGGHAMVEDTLRIADDTEKAATKEEIASAKLRIEARQRLASFWNPKELGQKAPETNVQISIGALHLDALRRRSVTATVVQPLTLAAPVEDAEIVSED